ncbi:hypothetical protein Tco_1049745, partial [Tanacetum coccineum]
KADSDAPTKQKSPTVPKEKKGKKTGKGKQKAKELETISEVTLTEAEQLKMITKRSHKETHNSHASGSGADEGTSVSPGVQNVNTNAWILQEIKDMKTLDGVFVGRGLDSKRKGREKIFGDYVKE